MLSCSSCSSLTFVRQLSPRPLFPFSRIVANIFGSDLDELDREAQQVARILGRVRGATEVQLQSPHEMPQMVVRLRDSDLARWGFDPIQVLDAIQTAYSGDTVGQVYEENRVFDVSVILSPQERRRGRTDWNRAVARP